MKPLRTVRNVDKMGRILLPPEFMEALDLKAGDYLEFAMEDGAIRLYKNSQGCVFCGQREGLHAHKGKLVCINCCWNMGDLKL